MVSNDLKTPETEATTPLTATESDAGEGPKPPIEGHTLEETPKEKSTDSKTNNGLSIKEEEIPNESETKIETNGTDTQTTDSESKGQPTEDKSGAQTTPEKSSCDTNGLQSEETNKSTTDKTTPDDNISINT